MEATVSMGDHAMTNLTTKPDSLQRAAEMAVDLFDNWFDPIETEVRAQRTTNAIERLHEELDQDADRAAVGRYRRDVVLGAARLRSDQHAQGGWLADARHKTHRSADGLAA